MEHASGDVPAPAPATARMIQSLRTQAAEHLQMAEQIEAAVAEAEPGHETVIAAKAMAAGFRKEADAALRLLETMKSPERRREAMEASRENDANPHSPSSGTSPAKQRWNMPLSAGKRLSPGSEGYGQSETEREDRSASSWSRSRPPSQRPRLSPEMPAPSGAGVGVQQSGTPAVQEETPSGTPAVQVEAPSGTPAVQEETPIIPRRLWGEWATRDTPMSEQTEPLLSGILRAWHGSSSSVVDTPSKNDAPPTADDAPISNRSLAMIEELRSKAADHMRLAKVVEESVEEDIHDATTPAGKKAAELTAELHKDADDALRIAKEIESAKRWQRARNKAMLFRRPPGGSQSRSLLIVAILTVVALGVGGMVRWRLFGSKPRGLGCRVTCCCVPVVCLLRHTTERPATLTQSNLEYQTS